MAPEKVYACSRCRKQVKGKDDLTVKMVRFTTMGERAKVIRSRVREWLCAECLLTDTDFNAPKFTWRLKYITDRLSR